MAEIDFYDGCAWLEPLLSERLDVETAIRRFLRQCERWFPDVNWAELREVEVRQDFAQLAEWLTYVLATEPPRGVRAFWFGLYDAEDDEHEYSGLYLSGSRKFRKERDVDGDCGWAVDPAYWPEARHSESKLLTEIHRVAILADNDGLQADYWGLLGCGTIMVSHLIRTVDRRLLLGRSLERAVAVGFDSGDNILLGLVRERSFPIRLRKRWPLPKIVRTPSGALFYEVKDDHRGRWFLDSPSSASSPYLGSWFATSGLPENARLRLRSEVLPNPKGKPVEFTYPLTGAPIVTERVASLLDRFAPECIQRLPITIANRRGRYEVLNVIRAVDCLDMARTKIGYQHPIDEDDNSDVPRPIGMIDKLVVDFRKAKGHDLFRLGENRNHLIVSRRIKIHLEAEKVSGIRLVPIAVSHAPRSRSHRL